jgi:prophage regulatory protein
VSQRTAVYRACDSHRALLYVGVCQDFGRRWKQHARTKPWWPEVRHLTVDWYDDEAEALRVEIEAIEQEKPRYNVATTNAHYRARRSVVAGAQPYMGTSEIARELRLSRQRVRQLSAEPDFPDPYEVLAAGKVWKRADVEAWAKDHGRVINDTTP